VKRLLESNSQSHNSHSMGYGICRKNNVLWLELIYIFDSRSFALSIRRPSSSCSATVRSGNSAGIIRLGDEPGIKAYFENSVTPVLRRKSSSSSSCPLTCSVGARIIARIASEKMVYITSVI